MLGKEDICSHIKPIQHIELITELEGKGVRLSDVESGSQLEKIDVLLGADSLPKLLTSEIIPTSMGPIAVNTTLGWTVLGGIESPTTQSNFSLSLFSLSDDMLPSIWDLETMGVTVEEQ